MSIARAQGEIDALVTLSGIPSTFLCPQSFMLNWLSFLAAQVKGGAGYAPHGTAAYSVIDARDIAAAAA
ncbi:MAG: NmrA family NAD(P)-binding protein, partial [Rhodoferax sp.]|nr:NmrA family NAD(P)-binding protein [Rhodoferax sp.]